MLTLRGARAAFGVAIMFAVTGLAACSGSGSGGAELGGGAAPRQGNSGKAQAALQQSAADLRKVVDGLTAPATTRAQHDFPVCPPSAGGATPTGACKGFDDAAPCAAAGSGQQWPRRWGYNVNLQLVGVEALVSGTSVVKLLETDKWTTHRNKSTSFVLDVSATKGGMSVRVVADDMPGVLNLEGYGPCVAIDGTVRPS